MNVPALATKPRSLNEWWETKRAIALTQIDQLTIDELREVLKRVLDECDSMDAIPPTLIGSINGMILRKQDVGRETT
jgi:hypothetical protein